MTQKGKDVKTNWAEVQKCVFKLSMNASNNQHSDKQMLPEALHVDNVKLWHSGL